MLLTAVCIFVCVLISRVISANILFLTTRLYTYVYTSRVYIYIYERRSKLSKYVSVRLTLLVVCEEFKMVYKVTVMPMLFVL